MMETPNWNTLHARINILRLIMFDKILHNLVDISLPESIITSVTADSAESMHKSTYSFFPAAMNLWNELPYHTVHATTLNSFCNLLTS